MYTNINPRNKHGRRRFGSSILVAKDHEKLIDIVIGERRQRHLLYVGILLLTIKFLTMNIIGFFVALMFYYSFFAFCKNEVSVSFTDKRVLSINKYKYPRIIRGFAIFAIGWVIVNGLTSYFQLQVLSLTQRIEWMSEIFNFFNILPIFFTQYVSFTQTYFLMLEPVDRYITLILNSFIGLQYLFLNFQFSEINNSQISDTMIRLNNKLSMSRLAILHTADLILILTIRNLSILIIMVIVTIHLIVPKQTYTELHYFGHSGRRVLPVISLSNLENHKIVRASRHLFGLSNFSSDRPFPLNIIPNQSASFYETGLQASLKKALDQGNFVGLLAALIINIFVIINLFNFAFTLNIDTLPQVFGIVGLIALGMFGFWGSLRLFNRRIQNSQEKEYLMIGNAFIARWVEQGLWIIRGNKIEGRRRKTKFSNRFLRYERAAGTSISWITIAIFVVIAILGFLLLFWISVGALNLANAIFIFPFLFNLGLSFLSGKANAELGFFIISSFVVWAVIYYFYPRIYRNSRPQLVIELEHLSTLAIILKNEEDHKDAIADFTKCIISSARPHRRPSIGRPGQFDLKIALTATWGFGNKEKIQFEFGENFRKSPLIELEKVNEIDPEILIKDLRVSADQGYPKIKFRITHFNMEGAIISTVDQEIDIESAYDNTLTFSLEYGLNLTMNFFVMRAIP